MAEPDFNPGLKKFEPALGPCPHATPGCGPGASPRPRRYLAAAHGGSCSALSALPHPPGHAAFSLGGRSDFSTFSVSRFVLSALILRFDHFPASCLTVPWAHVQSPPTGALPTAARSQNLPLQPRPAPGQPLLPASACGCHAVTTGSQPTLRLPGTSQAIRLDTDFHSFAHSCLSSRPLNASHSYRERKTPCKNPQLS